jgi:3-oxoacyl-(acyl-carrier-protein) synthase
VVVSEIFVTGVGAVSPAGWTVSSMRDALAKGEPLPLKDLARPGWSRPLKVRRVPVPAQRASFQSHARLRRTSPITPFAVSAGLEALGAEGERVRTGSLRLGIVLSVMAGCVNYSHRFYAEALQEPTTASPLVFPETVFNAPASHLAAFLGSNGLSYTLVGDPGMFLVGLSLGATWLLEDRVDACLVIGAEEIDWMVVDASRRFDRRSVLSEGAGAVLLSPRPPQTGTASVRLATVTNSHSYRQTCPRRDAARAMRAELPKAVGDAVLCDGVQETSKYDRDELAAWNDWTGPRISPKAVLGEGLAAGSAWQCVAAIDALHRNGFASALVSVVGCNQQAIGASFVKS